MAMGETKRFIAFRMRELHRFAGISRPFQFMTPFPEVYSILKLFVSQAKGSDNAWQYRIGGLFGSCWFGISDSSSFSHVLLSIKTSASLIGARIQILNQRTQTFNALILMIKQLQNEYSRCFPAPSSEVEDFMMKSWRLLIKLPRFRITFWYVQGREAYHFFNFCADVSHVAYQDPYQSLLATFTFEL